MRVTTKVGPINESTRQRARGLLKVGRQSAEITSNLPSKRLTSSEDDPISNRVVVDTLVKWGYQVISCSDGAQAWEMLRGNDPPEIAVLDWMMPGVDGLELCRRVRQSSNQASVYIILLTARGRKDDIIQGLEAGADDYISKPFDREQLRARMRVGARLVELQRLRLRRETAHYVEQLERAVTELQCSRRRIVGVQEDARKSVAEKLHGPVQTQLFMLSLKLGEIRDMIDSTPEQARTELTEAATELDSLRDNEIRLISHMLHPSIIGVGLTAGIRSLRDRYERHLRIGLEIAPDVVGREPPGSSNIPFEVRLGLYRVADEALANIIKHADASAVDVRLWVDDTETRLCLSVEDDGRGFDPDVSPRGLGTVTMEDYVGAIGGSLELDAAPGRGTCIKVTAPLSSPGGVAEQASMPPFDRTELAGRVQ